MRSLRTPLRRLSPLALAPMLLLASCGADKSAPLSAGSRPAIERVTPPESTAIPAPDVACPTIAEPNRMCWSDVATGKIIADFANGEERRDGMICWVRVWFGYPACRTD